MEKSRLQAFSEQTLVPVSFVVIILTAAYWIFRIESSAALTANSFAEYRAAQDTTTEQIRDKQQEQDGLLIDIARKIERIDAKVDFIYESAKRTRN